MKRLMHPFGVALASLTAALLLATVDTAGATDTKNVRVINSLTRPVPVREGGTPVQFHLAGLFQAGDVNLSDGLGLGPRAYTIPDGSTLLIKHASCRASVDANVELLLRTDMTFPPGSGVSGGPADLLAMLLIDSVSVLGGDRRAQVEQAHAYLGLNSSDGFAFGNTLSLLAQRDNTAGSGAVRCLISGQLYD